MVKKEILKVISNAISSVNNVDLQLEEDEIDEWFLFAVKEKENWPFNTIQHQIIFCNCCGNYLHFSSFEDRGHATQKVKCSCF